MGEPIDFSVSTMTDDGPVYFCCASCVEKFQKNPQKHAEKVAAQRELLRNRPRIQVNCPLSGEPIDRKVFTEQNGKKVYFCCAGCKAKYEKEPAKYAGKLEASYTYQTRCPVMGGEIDPAVFTDLPTGQRIYFCCAGCENRLLKDPEKYAPQLAAQGIRINVEKLKADREAHDNNGKRKRGGQDRP
jgi:YHS domain-containing protein